MGALCDTLVETVSSTECAEAVELARGVSGESTEDTLEPPSNDFQSTFEHPWNHLGTTKEPPPWCAGASSPHKEGVLVHLDLPTPPADCSSEAPLAVLADPLGNTYINQPRPSWRQEK